MQKVVGSNPISRFGKGLQIQASGFNGREVRLFDRTPNGHPGHRDS